MTDGRDIIAAAVSIAVSVHQGQKDKGGESYILHALEVGRQAALGLEGPNFEIVYAAGVLHDAIEDSPTGQRGRVAQRIYDECGSQVHSEVEHHLTRQDGEDYIESYIERVARSWVARRVKIADLTHNMDTGRLPEGDIGERDFERWDKYRRALVRLKKGAFQ